MKKLITSVFVLGLFACVSVTEAYAQGKGGGGGHVPSGGAPQTGSGHTDHGKSADHQGPGTKDFESRIENNPQLKAKLESLLPMGMDLKTAAMGFRNQGQFIAALHVAKNLNIPFDQLKAKMTGNPPESLGKAIHELKPQLTTKDADAEADIAEKQAKDTVKTKPIS